MGRQREGKRHPKSGFESMFLLYQLSWTPRCSWHSQSESIAVSLTPAFVEVFIILIISFCSSRVIVMICWRSSHFITFYERYSKLNIGKLRSFTGNKACHKEGNELVELNFTQRTRLYRQPWTEGRADVSEGGVHLSDSLSRLGDQNDFLQQVQLPGRHLPTAQQSHQADRDVELCWSLDKVSETSLNASLSLCGIWLCVI